VVRTCIACRKASDVGSDLIRVVLRDGSIYPSRTSLGRGAWLHIVCGREAIRRKSFRAAFKSSENFNTEELEKFLNEMDAKDMKQK
jgi:predicted RNA-binding protein YlxR (DUF448 family)